MTGTVNTAAPRHGSTPASSNSSVPEIIRDLTTALMLMCDCRPVVYLYRGCLSKFLLMFDVVFDVLNESVLCFC